VFKRYIAAIIIVAIILFNALLAALTFTRLPFFGKLKKKKEIEVLT